MLFTEGVIFVYYHWDCIPIYRPLSYPFRSLNIPIPDEVDSAGDHVEVCPGASDEVGCGAAMGDQHPAGLGTLGAGHEGRLLPVGEQLIF